MRSPTESRVFRIRPRVDERHPHAFYVQRIKMLAYVLRNAPKLDRRAIGAGIWIAFPDLEPRGVLIRATMAPHDWVALDDMAKRLGAPSTPRSIENALACMDAVLTDVVLRRTMTPEELAEMHKLEDQEAADADLEQEEVFASLDEEG